MIFHSSDNFDLSISITRVHSHDAGYYTCELRNNHDPLIRRSFDLRIKGKLNNFHIDCIPFV